MLPTVRYRIVTLTRHRPTAALGRIAVALCCWTAVWWASSRAGAAEPDPLLPQALEHVQKGRYDEARELLELLGDDEELPASDRVGRALLTSRLHEETGRIAQAQAAVQAALEKMPTSSPLWARLAEIQWRRGRRNEALKSVQQALDHNSQDLVARLVAAHLFADEGEIETAAEQFRWFVRYYNRVQPDDWQSLMTIAEGAAQYARWRSVSEIFKFIVNTICLDALKDNPNCWQASVMSGTLLLEKYNREQAVPEFHAALKINPCCAAAMAGLARAAMYDFNVDVAEQFASRALEVNPELIEALLIQADAAIYTGQRERARQFVRQALEVNPVDQQTLARRLVLELLDASVPRGDVLSLAIAAARSSIDASGPASAAAWNRTIVEAFSISPRPGVFLAAAGELLESRRHYEAAEVFYRQAIEAMPQLSAPRTSLGMLYMQTGRVNEAQQILDEAFQADPFHVRVSNMRKVLGVLKQYETIATEHFLLRIDASERLLGNEMAAYLESIYPELTSQLEYEPPARVQFEIYSDAKDQPAHAWFSARMIGLPWIQTIGASTGMIVALASPNKTQQPYNWARVLRHEFTHVLTLQKTRFQIPHWYTEALAVTAEADQLLDLWEQLLVSRVPVGEVYTLGNINSGFERPQSQDDWHMAYCQAKLYADYIRQRFGSAGLVQLLNAYTTTDDTAEALSIAFKVTVDDFEAGYRELLERTVEELRKGRRELPPPLPVAEAQAQLAPDSADVQSQLAYAQFRRRRLRSAFETAQRALALDDANQLARAILAAGALAAREPERALQLLEQPLQNPQPHPLVLELRASMAVRTGELPLAEELYQTLVHRYPRESQFQEDLLDVSDRLMRDPDELLPLLQTIARTDPDNAAVRKRLARLAADHERWEQAVRWAQQALHIDVQDADMHRLLAEHAHRVGHPRRSIDSYRALILLHQASADDRVALARLLGQHGQSTEAKQILSAILGENPQHSDARKLLLKLDQRP